jgi:hypothetical protein
MDRSEIERWLDAYGQAWQRRDADAAASLFSEDASYQWGPFEEPLRGRDAIRERWALATGGQADVSFGSEPLALTESVAVARWWVSFVRPVSSTMVELDGIFLLKFTAEGSCCSQLREWWNNRESQLG